MLQFVIEEKLSGASAGGAEGIPGSISTGWSGSKHGGQFHPLMDSVENEFQAVGNPDLIVDGAKMVLYGLLGDGKVRADFPVTPTLH